MAWSLCRALFGGVAVTSVAKNFLTTTYVEPVGYSMALVTVFLISEVAPFLLALSSDLLTLLAWDNYFFLFHGRRDAPRRPTNSTSRPQLSTAAQL